MKKLLPIFFTLFFYACANSQSWVPVGNGMNGYINTLYVYDSVMYAGGKFTSPANNIAQWNDSTWDSLSSGINNTVYAIGPYKDTIYVGGYFSEAGGHSAGCIAKWNGKSFSNAGFGFQGGQVSVIHAYDSLLYIGGAFDSTNHEHLPGLVTWNGTKVDSMETSYWYNVSILTTYENLLLLGFADIAGSYGQSIRTWNNRITGNLGNDYFYTSPPYTTSLYFNAFCQVDSNLYLGGSFLYYEYDYLPPKDTMNNITMWNGKTWTSLDKGINGTVYALAAYNGLIVAAGSFDSAGGVPVNNIAAWNGTTWSALGSGVNGTVYTLAVFKGNLYAGGDFNSPGSGIVEYTSPLEVNELKNNYSVNVYPNPNKGQFTVVCNRAVTAGTQPTIEIYNILGEKIYSANLVDENTTINLGEPSKGVYIYRILSSGSNLINPGKLVIE